MSSLSLVQVCLRRWILPCFLLLATAAFVSAAQLEWLSHEGYRSARLQFSTEKSTGFSLIPPAATGIHFTNVIALERHLTNQILLNGSGVAAGDVDGDGWIDLFFCGLDQENALYRNLANGRFQNITSSAGVAGAGMDATGAALVDFDGDKDLDLIFNTCGSGTHVYLNNGQAQFRRATPPAGLNPGKGGMSLAVGDYDGDGFLDFYVANYRAQALMDMPETHFAFKTVEGRQTISRVNGRPVTEPDLAGRFRLNHRGGIEENGEPDVLYRNLGGTNVFPHYAGDGTFLDNEGARYVEAMAGWGLSAMFRDLNGDRRPDLYVCNDFNSPDQLWINQGQGRFKLAPPLALRRTSMFSMGIDFADINRDGSDDFVVLDMLCRDHEQRMDMMGDRDPFAQMPGEFLQRPEYLMNTLFLNRGNETFAEIAQLSGLSATDWSWTALFLDVDLDGYEDLLISNGHERAARSLDIADKLRNMRAQKKMSPREITEARRIYPRQAARNAAFRNRGDLTFEDCGGRWGFDELSVSHGMALADLDNDGDCDLAVNHLNQVAGIYRNDCPASRLAVRLKGNAPNTRGIGARITVRGGPVDQSQEMVCGGRYLSSDDPMRVFATGAKNNLLTIEVAWPGGKTSVISNAQPDYLYEVFESGAQPGPAPHRSKPEPAHFEDVTALLQHKHVEEPFDDFALQPLLTRRLSQLGPGVGWYDLDGDGWEDLLIGSGRGGQLAAYRNNGSGGFARMEAAPWNQPVTRDQTAVLGWRRETGGAASVLVGSANYEDGLTNGSLVREYQVGEKTVTDPIKAETTSAGPMAMADVDGDGDLDLFVGGRVKSGRYAEGGGGWLYRREAGGWKKDAANSAKLAGAGLVSGAVWSDLDGDGDSDLVLACDWGPVRVYRNERGMLTESTQALGLEKYTGWWNGVATGDFNGDGRMDIVASNWGRNSPYEMHRAHPLALVQGDVDGNGTVELIEAHFDPKLNKQVPNQQLDFLRASMPWLQTEISSRGHFARLSVQEIIGRRADRVRTVLVTSLEASVFMNNGTGFVYRVLPAAAQMTASFAVAVADLDGDGREDLYLGQNFFGTLPGMPRYDAGLGLWLKGQGDGEFQEVAAGKSGLQIPGEQRGCALADFDHDGRVDLVCTQNGAETRLFRNRVGRPGLRVVLQGPGENLDAIGAMIRVGNDLRLGPAREVHLGSGYWAQDAAAQVMTFDGAISRLWVRWPGGKEWSGPIAQETREAHLNIAGHCQQK